MKRKPTTKPDRRKIKSIKVTIDGITFDSTLEGEMYKLIKESGIKFKYQFHNYSLLEGFTYQNDIYERYFKKNKYLINKPVVRKMEYRPDFTDIDGTAFIIETKGRANESFPLRWKIFKWKMSLLENPPLLFQPTTISDCQQVITILKEKGF